MSGRDRRALAATVVLVVSALQATASARERQVLVLPLQDRAGDMLVATAVDTALRQGFGQQGIVVNAREARQVARRFRLRNPDTAKPEVLRQLGREMDADWIVSATIHEALRGEVPRLTLSVRLLEAETAELLWAGFEAASGLDSHSVLGLGIVYEPELLAEKVVHRLLADLPLDETIVRRGKQGDLAASVGQLGRVAIVPFAGLARRQPIRAAESVTEAARAATFALGVELVSGNAVTRALRAGTVAWGEIDAATRERLRETTNADTMITGVVEAYEEGGGISPRPRIMVSVRILDARTGRLLAVRGLERDGWDGQGLLELGRVYSGGALSKRALEILLEQTLRQAVGRTSG